MTIAEYQPQGGTSPFTGADVCTEAGLHLPAGVVRPVFEDDLWDFTHVDGLPVSMSLVSRRFDFAAIADPRWRLVTKQLVLAMLAPRHPVVVALPRAHRNVMHLASCFGRLDELTRFFAWLSLRGLTSLRQVDTRVCEAYLAHRRYVRDDEGTVVGERSPGTRRAAAQVVVDLVNYRELFTADADSVPETLRPWGGATASAIAEMPSGREENTTQPVDDAVMQPMLAAALYLVEALGPHAVTLAREIRDSDQAMDRKTTQWPMPHRTPVAEFQSHLIDLEQTGTPLPKIENHRIAMRLADGWDPLDPLLPVATGILARYAGVRQWHSHWMRDLRGLLEDAVAAVGVEPHLARRASLVTSADGASTLPWTLPLHRSEAVALVGIVRTATIIVIAAASGMRASELMELRLGCRRPPEEIVPGLVRYRIASKVIKGQPLGGTADEWVVIEPVYRAIALAELLHEAPAEGAPLFGRFSFGVRYKWFRKWINSDAAGRLGLAAIPAGPVNLRMLRRTLALEMAYRPGGVLATKIHLKHISVATTEGYANRPGGAQAELLAEVNKHESERNLQLVFEEFRNYQQGILPTGPGARSLTDFFASIDGNFDDASALAPKAQRSDRDILILLTKRANTLHLGPANYCWFTDSSRALCLKLAGTPTADRPLVGMCDSARCPQATHHPCHRPVWAEHAERAQVFLGQIGTTRRTERARLQTDYDRAARVVAEIDAASTGSDEERA